MPAPKHHRRSPRLDPPSSAHCPRSSTPPPRPAWRPSPARLLRAPRRSRLDRAAATVAHAREAGLLVIPDGKRGDIPSSAAAYSQALTGPRRAFGDVRACGRRDDRKPAHGPRPARPADRRRPAKVPGVPARAHLEPRRRRRPTCRSPTRRPCGSGRPMTGDLGEAPHAGGRARRPAASPARNRSPSTSRACATSCRAPPFLLPGIGAQGGRVSRPRARLRPRPRGRIGHRLAHHRQAHETDPRETRPGPPAPKPSACGTAWNLAVKRPGRQGRTLSCPRRPVETPRGAGPPRPAGLWARGVLDRRRQAKEEPATNTTAHDHDQHDEEGESARPSLVRSAGDKPRASPSGRLARPARGGTRTSTRSAGARPADPPPA